MTDTSIRQQQQAVRPPPQAPTSGETYDFDTLKRKQEKVTGETGSITVALASTISAYKEPTLFDELEKDEDLQALVAMDKKHLVNREGKPTYLTRYQNKIIYVLSLFMSQSKEDEEIRAYVKKLNAGEAPKSTITLPISITELTKLVELDGKARARQKEKVLDELKALAEIRQVQMFMVNGSKDGKLRYIAPLIQIQEQLEDLSPDKQLNADFVRVSFGSIFFYELYNKYAVIKPSLFRIWGKAGSGTDTELFNILLSDLLAKYSGHRIAAIRAVKEVEKNAKKYKSEESYKAAKEKAQRDALTYSEYTYNLRRRIATDYESLRSYRARFKEHLKNAINALLNYGLITEARFTNTDKGERIDFVFNMDYDKNEEGESIYLAQARQREIDSLPLLQAPEE